MTPPDLDDPELEAQLSELLDVFSSEELAHMARRQKEHEEFAQKLGPQTKEELWEWFRDVIGVKLGRVAVCPGHSSQLDMAWEVYSFQVLRVLWVLSRGGGKTSLMAWLDYCQAEHYPGWESFTIGPGKNQGERKYEHMLPFVVEGGVIGGKELDHIARSIQTKTIWKTGSAMEIALGGTVDNANGPRVPRLHRDETELMQNDTYKQAGNIPAGRECRDGRYAPAQIVDTSTMKWAGGRVDKEMEAYDEAIKKGERPRMEVRIACLYEVAAENPACRSAPKEEREARLVELGRDPSELCDCDTYINDVWEVDDTVELDKEPEERTLESVCQGRFFRSRGYKRFDDVQTLFLENDRETWEAEQECSQPSREGAFVKSYSEFRHGVKGYDHDPANGPIFLGVDWGGTDEHSVGWYQYLEREVQVQAYKGDRIKTLPAGSLVLFSEIFRAGIGDVELGQIVQGREAEWMVQYPGWHVEERYPDSANASGRMNWRDHLSMHTTSRIKKDFKAEVKYIRTWVGNSKYFVDIQQCPVFNKAIKAWKAENGVEVHDWASHPMAQLRYVLHNLEVSGRKQARKENVGSNNLPAAADDADDRVREREHELVKPEKEGAAVVVIGEAKPEHGLEEIGDLGAEDSPLREAALSMGSESEYRAGFGGNRPVR